MDYITIGEILRPQGIKGEIKVKPLTDEPERFKKLRVVYIDEKPYRLSGVRSDAAAVFLRMQGVDDRNAAEALRGKHIKIDKVNAVACEENEFYISDVVGCDVVDDDGCVMGVITDILKYGAADVICCKGERGEFRFPFLNRVVQRVDVDGKKFFVVRKLLDEVCVYDD